MHTQRLSVSGCKEHIELTGSSVISHVTCSERGNVLDRRSMPQCADLTYIVANGSFRIWFISRSYTDEIMYEIIFHVLQSCKWLAHILVSLLSWLTARLYWCSVLMLQWWPRWVKVFMFFPVIIIISRRSSTSSDTELFSGCAWLGWRLRQSSYWAVSGAMWSDTDRKCLAWLLCGHMSQVMQDFNFKVCSSERVRSVSLARIHFRKSFKHLKELSV